jgi:hypothetical protein
MDKVPNLSTFNVKGDNRNINDDQSKQALTSDHIENLKEKGASG